MADAASAPLEIKASAAASLLRDGVPGEDVGAAAGLANPDGEAWDPVSLARLADAVVRKLQAAAAADARDAGPSADDAWNEVGGEDESGDDGGWWDPESLAALLCALAGSHRGSRARLGGDIDPKDQATLAHSLVRTHEWEHATVGDLLWCIHACTSGDSSPLTSMERVEEAAEVVLELARPRRPGPGCGLGWSMDEASSLLPAVLPAPHWKWNDGLVGMSAVKGSALLAARDVDIVRARTPPHLLAPLETKLETFSSHRVYSFCSLSMCTSMMYLASPASTPRASRYLWNSSCTLSSSSS